MGRIPAVDQPLGGVLPVAITDLLNHRGQLRHVGAGRGRCYADNDLRCRVADELAVVGGTITAVGHLHDRRCGIGRGDPRRLRCLALFGLDRGHLRQAFERLLNAFFPLTGRTLARRLLPPRHRSGVLLALTLEVFDLRPGLLQAPLQGLATPERRGASTGADADPILGHPLERDRPRRQQGRYAVGQQGVERLAMGGAKSATVW